MTGKLIYKCKRCDQEIEYYTENLRKAIDYIHNCNSKYYNTKKRYDKHTYGNIPDGITIIHSCFNSNYIYGVAEFIGYNSEGETKWEKLNSELGLNQEKKWYI